MARYNVLLTTIDGQATNVSVDANSISEARRKAESQYVGSRASGVPELVASPVGSESFTSMVSSIDPNYDPSAYGVQQPLPPYSPNQTPYDPPTYNELDYRNLIAEGRIADPQEQVPTFLRSQQPTTDMYMPYDPSTRPPSYGSGMDLGGIVSPEDAEARLNNPAFIGDPTYGGSEGWKRPESRLPSMTLTPYEIAIAEANAAAERRIADIREQQPTFSFDGRVVPQMPYNPPYREREYGYGADLGGIVSPEDAEARLNNSTFMGDMNRNVVPAYGGADPWMPYDPLVGGAGKAVISNPISADLANQLDFANSQGNQGFGIDPVYGETSDPVSADLRNQLDFANSQANAVPDFMTGAELDAAEAAQFALDQRKRDDQLREEQKQASLLTGPVRSWDAKLGDITLSYDAKGNVSKVNLPIDMWRNASKKIGSVDQKIGREQIEDAIRRIAELGGRDNLDRSVSNMLQQARNYYSTTSRGGNNWNKSIDSGLIDGKLLSDAGFKATWGSFADEVLGAKEADVTGQIPDAWASNPDGFKSLSKTQQTTVIENNLKSMSEFESYTAEQANQLESGFDAESLYDTGKGVGLDEELPDFTTKGFDFGQSDGTTGVPLPPAGVLPPTGELGPNEGGNYDQTLPVVPPPPVFGPQPPPAAGSFPALSSQELINDPQGYLTAAGQRLAFRNVYGDAATGVGPLSSYLQRQTFPLTNAYRAASFANMGREQAGGVAPQVSFEDFLRTTRNQPSGLSGTSGQALQDVGYLRGLGGSQVPVGLEGVFNPEQSANTRDARNLLAAAQRGKYSGLVSSAFRRPTEDDLFSDYVLARQDASTAGTAPQNFLNFAASRYGL